MDDYKLIRFIERKCSSDEVLEISNWINASNENKKHFYELQTVWASVEIVNAIKTQSPDQERIDHILSKIKIVKRQSIIRKSIIYASLAGAVAAILLFIYLPYQQEQISIVDYETAIAHSTFTNDIQLTLDNGESILISDSSATLNYNQGSLVINNDTFQTKKQTEPTLHTIHIPYGKRSKIILADGSTVHLNSGTSFVYPSFFDKSKREVFLDGEGYFDIKEDKSRPFIVKTSYKSVNVLGTQFNVMTDKESNIFETVLVKGSVSINGEKESVVMTPNQLYSFSDMSKEEELKTVDIMVYVAWLDGRMQFEREPLATVIRKLEKAYNVQINILNKELLNNQISGDLNLRDSPEDVMKVLMYILIPDYKSASDMYYQISER